MNPWELMPILPQIIPLLPRLEKAIDKIKQLEADPEVQDILALGKQLAQIFEQLGSKK